MNIIASENQKPINYNNCFETVLRENLDSIKLYQNDIVKHTNFLVPFCFKLSEIKDAKLFDLLKNDPLRFLRHLKEAIYNELIFDETTKKILISFGISSLDDAIERLPVSFNYQSFEYYFPEITDHSQNLSNYVNKICRFVGRYLDTSLIMQLEYEKLMFKCLVCGEKFEMHQTDKKYGEPYRKPRFCMKSSCKAKSQSDFTLDTDESQSYEIRLFHIGDLDITKPIVKKCVIFHNIAYFIEHTKNINVEDTVEVVGVLRIDSSDLGRSRKEDYEFTYYIEVIDIQKSQNRLLDPKIMKDLKKRIEENPNTVIDLINDINPYTKYIYEYFIVKLLITLSWITSNSYREDGSKRNSINNIIGGHTGTIKSSEVSNFQRILGANVVIKLSGQAITEKGLIPTSNRVKDEKDIIIKFGAFRYASRNLLVIDEAHYLTILNLVHHKCLEEGRIDKATDGSLINAEAKGSVIHLINYINNENELYDYWKPLIENLPEAYKKQPSIFERMDSHFAIPPISQVIEDLFFMRQFISPNKEFSDLDVYNYLHCAKVLYTEFNEKEIDKTILSKIREIAFALDKGNQKRIRTPRQRKIIIKYLKAIACLHLRDYIIESDLEFLKKHLIHTIIPFYDNTAIDSLREPEMNQIFQWSLRILKEIKDEISVGDHVSLIRECLRNNFFPNSNGRTGTIHDIVEKGPADIDNYMSETTNLTNLKYKTLLESQKDFIENLDLTLCSIKNKTTIAKKEYLIKEILKQLVELYNDNKQKALKISDVIKNIELTLSLDNETSLKIIEVLKKEGRLIKKQNLLHLNCIDIKL